MAIIADSSEQRVLPRTLAGATVLQIVTALRDSSQVRTTIGAARALVQVGARAIVAGERGELVDELKSFGGEWLPFASATVNPTKLRANADALDKFLAAERVDIVHAKNAGAAWSALIATDRNGAHLITDLPDLPGARMWLATFYLGSLSRGDRVISHSMFNARPMIARHRIPPERVSVVPRSIDLAHFNPGERPAERVTRLRQVWGIPHGRAHRIGARPHCAVERPRRAGQGGAHSRRPEACAASPSFWWETTGCTGGSRASSGRKRRPPASIRCSAWSVITPTCPRPTPRRTSSSSLTHRRRSTAAWWPKPRRWQSR